MEKNEVNISQMYGAFKTVTQTYHHERADFTLFADMKEEHDKRVCIMSDIDNLLDLIRRHIGYIILFLEETKEKDIRVGFNIDFILEFLMIIIRLTSYQSDIEKWNYQLHQEAEILDDCKEPPEEK
jgi:hypothetical protein